MDTMDVENTESVSSEKHEKTTKKLTRNHHKVNKEPQKSLQGTTTKLTRNHKKVYKEPQKS